MAGEEQPLTAAEVLLDDIVCRGAATDVYLADQARLMLEEINGFVERINRTGIGLKFVANLQGVLQRELTLSLCRVCEPYSPRNPSRSLPAAIPFIQRLSPVSATRGAWFVSAPAPALALEQRAGEECVGGGDRCGDMSLRPHRERPAA
jgi:hypothetical protein